MRYSKIYNAHPLRITSICREYNVTDIQSIVNEAIAKRYNVIVASNPAKNKTGLVIYRNIGDIEIAYNPEWDNHLLAQHNINLSDYVYIDALLTF